MKELSSSETSVSIYQTTRRDMPEDSKSHTRRRENLESHLAKFCDIRSDLRRFEKIGGVTSFGSIPRIFSNIFIGVVSINSNEILEVCCLSLLCVVSIH
jgi:hypothetical protein